MLCVGISHVTLKSGEPRVIINALSRRNGTEGYDTQKVWISEEEYKRSGIALGLEFRAFSDGGLYILDDRLPIDIGPLNQMA